MTTNLFEAKLHSRQDENLYDYELYTYKKVKVIAIP